MSCRIYNAAMNHTIIKSEKKHSLRCWFALCPARHCLCLLGALVIAAYFALRGNATLMQSVSDRVVRPFHRFVARLCNPLPFSAAEALIAVAVVAGLVYIIYFVICMVKKQNKGVRVYRFALTVLTAFSLIYGGFCVLWGVYYYASDFEQQSGIYGVPVSVEQLTAVTRRFTDLVNDYSVQVRRNDAGEFCEDINAVFDRAPQLYDSVAPQFSCLSGDALHAKPMTFSRLMSYLNFTGFFSPFTGEANINVDAPAALIPATIAHELAHQRGVAAEDEANFVAVLSCLESGDPVYSYSASLMAYIYLGNALYKADYDAWAENYARLSDGVRADLAQNSAYWAQFETPVGTAADNVYTLFLESYGQTLGLQTYGKCVDLLVAYYYNDSSEALE